MKKRVLSACTNLLGAFILIFFVNDINAQDNAAPPRKPYMFSYKNPQYLKNFNNIKLPLLDDHTNTMQPRSFRLGNFLGMIEYFNDEYGEDFECLHVYIAAYSDEYSAHVPKNCGTLLTLIFAPATKNSKTDLGYFTIPPNESFDENYIEAFTIEQKIYKEWTDNYITKVMPAITGTVDDIPANQINGDRSDTRCITYCKEDLLELVNEPTFPHFDAHSNKITIKTDMMASFAAFDEHGNPNNHDQGAKRLFIQFDFLDAKGKIVHLEHTRGFEDRPAAKTTTCPDCHPADKKVNDFRSLDNGQLCPPCDNCPSGYSGCGEIKKKKRD